VTVDTGHRRALLGYELDLASGLAAR